jgi:hypothetical protein
MKRAILFLERTQPFSGMPSTVTKGKYALKYLKKVITIETLKAKMK